jgi:hypothetical protein
MQVFSQEASALDLVSKPKRVFQADSKTGNESQETILGLPKLSNNLRGDDMPLKGKILRTTTVHIQTEDGRDEENDYNKLI